MPLYEYRCDKCRQTVEVIQGINADHTHTCECGRQSRRLWATGVRTIFDFRSGWDPGIGTYVDTKRQRENELRVRNMEKAQ